MPMQILEFLSAGGGAVWVAASFVFLYFGIRGKDLKDITIPKKQQWTFIILGALLVMGFVVFVCFLLYDNSQTPELKSQLSDAYKVISTLEFEAAQQPESSTQTPTTASLSTEDQIEQAILMYYNNIPNDRITDSEIDTELAWSVVHPLLGAYWNGEDDWRESIFQVTNIINMDFKDSIEYESSVAKADIVLEKVFFNGEREDAHTITICLWRVSGQWFIRHIHTSIQSLNACKQ
jgi:hypothetical protein